MTSLSRIDGQKFLLEKWSIKGYFRTYGPGAKIKITFLLPM